MASKDFVPSPPLITPCLGMLAFLDKVFDLFTPLPHDRFPSKLAPNAPNNMQRNLLFHSFASLLIVLLKPSVNPFAPNAALLLYPLKTSQIHTVFWCFEGLEKIGNKWLNDPSYLRDLTNSMIFSISLFEIISVVVLDTKIFF